MLTTAFAKEAQATSALYPHILKIYHNETQEMFALQNQPCSRGGSVLDFGDPLSPLLPHHSKFDKIPRAG